MTRQEKWRERGRQKEVEVNWDIIQGAGVGVFHRKCSEIL